MRLATFAFRDHPDDEKTDDEMKTFKEKNDILEFLESITLKLNFYFETLSNRTNNVQQPTETIRK